MMLSMKLAFNFCWLELAEDDEVCKCRPNYLHLKLKLEKKTDTRYCSRHGSGLNVWNFIKEVNANQIYRRN